MVLPRYLHGKLTVLYIFEIYMYIHVHVHTMYIQLYYVSVLAVMLRTHITYNTCTMHVVSV